MISKVSLILSLFFFAACGHKGKSQNEVTTGTLTSTSTNTNASTSPDTTAPTVSIIFPEDGSAVYSLPVVQFSASDDGTVAKIELYVDDGLAGDTSTSPYSFQLPVVSQGKHVLVAKAYDSAGNVATSAPITIYYYDMPLVGDWLLTQATDLNIVGSSVQNNQCDDAAFTVTYSASSGLTFPRIDLNCQLFNGFQWVNYSATIYGFTTATQFGDPITHSSVGTTFTFSSSDLKQSYNPCWGSPPGSGCSGSDTISGVPLRQPPPSGLTYTSNPLNVVQGNFVSMNAVNFVGAPLSHYSITPALPSGFSFDSNTGAITGRPLEAVPTSTFTVVGTNLEGAASVQVSITVTALAPPTNLSYSSNPASYMQGFVISSNLATVSGSVAQFSISPTLPAGLIFNTATGAITGTPSVLSPATNYIVTASNLTGSTTVELSIAVVADVPPSNLSYASNPAVYMQSMTIVTNTVSSSGGAILNCSISPGLPAGLSFNTSTCAISGTPSVILSTTNYSITASNFGGSTSTQLTLTINPLLIPPSSFAYSNPQAVYIQGTQIASNTTSVGGTQPMTFTISPALPAGLSINLTNGSIGGTPSVLSPATTYTVTCTNAGGSSSSQLSIAVVLGPPTNLYYATPYPTYYQDAAISPNNPSYQGGAPTSFSVSPALPQGLSLDPTTGVISGTPTVVSAQTNYQVTASNSGGSAKTQVTITVLIGFPNISYSPNPANYVVGQAITPMVPASSGGIVNSYYLEGGLPAGLSLDTTTGIISGTPTTTGTTTLYVAATNSTGTGSVLLTFNVNPAAPSNLTYSTNPAVYKKSTAITANVPSYLGGQPTSYTISPTLPSGLFLDAGSGNITGTPTVLSSASVYTVTASNFAGSTSVQLTISVTR